MLSSIARIAVALLAFGWLGAAQGQAAAQTPPSNSDGIDQAVQDQLLQEAVDQIKAGSFADAINGPLAQIIHTYETAYGHSKKRIYCAESTTEVMLYLATAAQNHQEAQVLAKPTWALAYYVRGYAYGSLGRTADAEASLKQALQLSPSNSQFLSELGNAYEHEKDWPQALKTFQDADTAASVAARNEIKVPLRCRALRGQGYVYVELHQLDDATKAYQQCLAIQPGDPASLRELGYVQGLRDKGAK
ncbi:tetratricopeptide repeat protein [Dyella psychrodurans]|uniref:Tetratricopeptide repeat protein n=1 Tax=Dyella psychrodurans TaxID=1927960 RepID=A0A370WVK0_9GAMM|nr:tetratricopeptide repeat protein [Dyella psychrodurans]RDS79985.1 tetratricopeptide repeat protein [Dyella psychrodurans]